MKISRKLMLAPMALCLLPLLQGCSSSPATGIEEAGMSLTRDDTSSGTTTFKTSDSPLYANATLNGIGNGAKVKIVWTLVDAGGEKNASIGEKELVLDGDKSIVSSDFKVTASGGLPKGSYKTDIYFNDKLDKTLEWKVQ
jgi:hypothetical protein